MDEEFTDPVQETARRFAVNLKSAIQKKYGNATVHAAADLLGINHKSLGKILSGVSYPDLPFIVNMETRLGRKLWPPRTR